MELQEIIAKLCALHGPSGFEESPAEMAKSLLEPYMDEVSVDVMGNVIGVKRCGKENAPKLMFDAHLDEIGFIVTGHENGFVKFAAIGGVDPRMLPACEIELMTDPPVYGVVCAVPAITQSGDETEKAAKIEELYIDIGMTDEEARLAAPVGTPGVYRRSSKKLGDDLICGKTMDDRACFACLVKAAELLKDEKLNVDLYILGSTQEEVGLRGAETAAYSVYPDYCVAVDVGHGTTPDCKNWQTFDVGGGVMICKGPNMNKGFTDNIVKTAGENGIPYQISVEPYGNSGTNTAAIQMTRQGVCTALLSLPLKYMHTPVEVISLKDADNTAKLLAELARNM